MKIGIVGLGIVGGACKFGFEKLGHTVFPHDLKYNTKLSDLLVSDVIFICVPTPVKDGLCDTSIVESVVREIDQLSFTGIVAIKSTVIPGTTERLKSLYTKFSDLCFVPEFLRERSNEYDFVENHKLLAVGTDNNDTFEIVKTCHGEYPKYISKITPTQAELLKYYHNAFNALRVVFANEFYNISQFFGEDYTPIKQCLLKTSGLPDIYFDVNENMRGYSSICWNKDIPAIISFCKNNGIKIPLIETIVSANNNFKKTPFEGTRE